MRIPAGFEKWNPALRGAYRKGYEAASAGLPITACPYEDKRRPSGGLSWSRSFISAWCDGWRDSQRHRDESARAAIDEYYKDRNNSGQAALTAHR